MSTEQLAGDALKEALKNQVEFYFSKANLVNDSFLVSQMNSQMFVPIDVIIGFSKIKQLTDDVKLIVEAVKDSKVCSLNAEGDAIKPNIKSERNTIILREIPSGTKPEDVEAIFEGCGKVTGVRSDVGDTWFVTMESEEEAVNTLLSLRNKTFNNAPIKARLKSENVLRSFIPSAATATESAAPASSTPYQPTSSFYGNAAYYNQAVPNAFGVQYAGRTNPKSATKPGKKDSKKQGNATATTPTSGKKTKEKKKKDSGATTPKSGKNGERQPILNAANFPPLPNVAPGLDINFKYTHDDIMEIVKNMDDTDCTLPRGKMDFEAHESALTPVAHPDLLKNQRTYSIEQAREALRQGRPIRSDSVGSVDYESLMYGEEYTKEARELRAQQTKDDGEAKKSSNVPVGGYAAALIHGAPVSPKKSAPAKEESPSAPPAPITTETKPKAEKKQAAASKKKEKKTSVDTAAPVVAGAWGGRSFVDVVTKPKDEKSTVEEKSE